MVSTVISPGHLSLSQKSIRHAGNPTGRGALGISRYGCTQKLITRGPFSLCFCCQSVFENCICVTAWGSFSPFSSRTFPQTLVHCLLPVQAEFSSGELPSSFDPNCIFRIPLASRAVCPVAVSTRRLAALWGVLQFSRSGISEVIWA